MVAPVKQAFDHSTDSQAKREFVHSISRIVDRMEQVINDATTLGYSAIKALREARAIKKDVVKLRQALSSFLDDFTKGGKNA